MTKNEKKAAPVLQHQDGQVETGPTFQSGPHLHQQFTTTPPSGQAVKVSWSNTNMSPSPGMPSTPVIPWRNAGNSLRRCWKSTWCGPEHRPPHLKHRHL